MRSCLSCALFLFAPLVIPLALLACSSSDDSAPDDAGSLGDGAALPDGTTSGGGDGGGVVDGGAGLDATSGSDGSTSTDGGSSDGGDGGDGGATCSTPAAPTITSVSAINLLNWVLPGAVRTEESPIVIPGAHSAIYMPHTYTYLCSNTANPLLADAGAPLTLDESACTTVALPVDQSDSTTYIAPGDGGIPVGTAQWKLNYVSVNGAHVTTDSQGNDVLLTVDHGETKTYEAAYDKAGDRYYYQGPFTPSASFLAGGAPYNESPPDLTCGYNGYTGAGGGGLGSGFKTCYKGYSGFVFTATNTFSAANDYGMSLADDSGGPVMWPTPGYYDLATPKQLATGFRGGSSILANGYLYIFVLDDNLGDPLSGTIAGQTVSLANKGEKVARALIGADGKPGPFMSYNVFTDAFDAPSLPAGFDKTRIADFIDVPGPQVPALFSLEALNDTGYPLETNRFSVAFDPARNLYIGIEHYSSGNGGQSMAFRESCDLVHWSPRSVLMSGGAPLDASSFNYPAFVDSAFTTNYVVDSSNLYILGTNSDPDLKTSATYYLQASLR